MRAALLAAVGLTTLLLTGCGGSGSRTPSGRSTAATMPQLRSIAQLRGVFNAHKGIPRLLVLISPT